MTSNSTLWLRWDAPEVVITTSRLLFQLTQYDDTINCDIRSPTDPHLPNKVSYFGQGNCKSATNSLQFKHLIRAKRGLPFEPLLNYKWVYYEPIFCWSTDQTAHYNGQINPQKVNSILIESFQSLQYYWPSNGKFLRKSDPKFPVPIETNKSFLSSIWIMSPLLSEKKNRVHNQRFWSTCRGKVHIEYALHTKI